MSDEFHYVRTLGDEGGVDAVDGPAIGLDLESILQDGLPPFKVALELTAACCEILDIAAEDGEIHGDVELKHIFLDETGAVSIEGFGVDRSKTPAPEGEPNELTDLYALGRTAFALLSPKPLTPPLDDADAHDDNVIEHVLGMNFEGMPEAFHGDVQWFVAKLMSFDPEDRPEAYEAWKTFIAFADETPGPALADWGADAVEGEGERRDSAKAGQAMQRPDEDAEPEEDLGGPVQASGPLKSGLSFGGAAPKGQATAFWSKDAMKAALESRDDDDEDQPKARPPVGAAQATAFWSKADMQAMTDTSTEAAAGGASQRPKRQKSGRAGSRPAGPATADKPAAPAVGGPVAQGPGPSGPARPTTPPPMAAEPAEGGNTGLIIAAVAGIVLLAVLVCGGIASVGGLAVVMGGGDAAPADKAKSTDKRKPEPSTQDTGTKGGKNKADKDSKDDKKKASKPKPRPSSRPSSKPSSRPSSRPSSKPKPKPAPAPAPAGGPARVNFKSNGRGSVSCAGKNKSFDGITTITIDEFQLPATCLVTIDGGRGVFQVYGSGSVTCDGSGGSVNCSPLSVGG